MSLKTPAGFLAKYQKQYDTEEWEAFATQVRRDRGNCCEVCKMGNKATQVHHVFYDFKRKITDYSGDEIMLLCAECHHQLHENLNKFRKHVFHHLKPQAFRVLNGALAVGLRVNDPLELCYAIAELVSEPRLVKNYCNAFINRPPSPQADDSTPTRPQTGSEAATP